MATREDTPPRTSANQHNSKPNSKHWLEYAIFVFVVLTAVATGTAAWYTRQQWVTAHDTLIVSERAFVSFGTNNAFIGNDPAKGWVIAIVSPIVNSGNTRTRDLTHTVKCLTSTDRLIEPWGLFRQEKVTHEPQILPPRGTITTLCSFTVDQFKQMSDGKMFGYIVGEVNYRDTFTSMEHVTQFENEAVMAHYEPASNPGPDQSPIRSFSIQWQNKGEHNCADEDCPND